MAERVWRRLDRETRTRIVRLAAKGSTYREIAKAVNRSKGSVQNVLGPMGGVSRGDIFGPSPNRHLSIDDRVEISIGLGMRYSFAQIGRELDRSTSTVSREVNANGGRGKYRPPLALTCVHPTSPAETDSAC